MRAWKVFCWMLRSLAMVQTQPVWMPHPVNPSGFNPAAKIPYGCSVKDIQGGMEEFVDFLTFLNKQLVSKKMDRLESFLMPANFSSMVGEFMAAGISRQSSTITKNNYHNGHPDLVPVGRFPDNAVQHSTEGVEIKSSRYHRGWQGHNAEDVWLMVFVFDSNTAADTHKGISDKPFRFLGVYGAQLKKSDWTFSGRSKTSRRTITASINGSGYAKMTKNWIYKDPAKIVDPADSLQEAADSQAEE